MTRRHLSEKIQEARRHDQGVRLDMVAALREWISDQRSPTLYGYEIDDHTQGRYDAKEDLLDDLGQFLDRWEQEDE